MSDGEVKGSFYRTEIIAQLFGVTVRRVQQLTQEGIISTTKILEDGKSVRRLVSCLKRNILKQLSSLIQFLLVWR